tara:strand:+ start:30554 stop:31189 length:636 start_codon:yes stop_codon:yes gene_type:complete
MSTPFNGDNLTCIRGSRLVFKGLSFELSPGGALLLTGANGSGKTSLLRLMAGLAAPAEGVIRVDGSDIRDDPSTHRANLHYIAHYDAAKPALTVYENLSFWTSMHNGGDVDAGLSAFGLSRLSGVPVRFLSAGQRRRLAMARLIAIETGIWLLDEPSIALDTASLDALHTQIVDHRSRGGIVVASTHRDLHLQNAATLNVSEYGVPGAVPA